MAPKNCGNSRAPWGASIASQLTRGSDRRIHEPLIVRSMAMSVSCRPQDRQLHQGRLMRRAVGDIRVGGAGTGHAAMHRRCTAALLSRPGPVQMHCNLSYMCCGNTGAGVVLRFILVSHCSGCHRRIIGLAGDSTSTTQSIRSRLQQSRMPAIDDATVAVASLHAAGDDIESLQEAIQKASFLEAVAGDNRQKLRAAKSKLRKLLTEAAKGGPSGEKSPHAKAEYSTSEFEALTQKYEKLNWRMISRPGGATTKPDDFYRLHALHMQATQGDNTAERPMWAERGGLDFEGRARWDAWTAVKGMDADKGKLRFVKLYYEFLPSALYKDTRGQI